jgi:sec-independent protein translocase protein TatA
MDGILLFVGGFGPMELALILMLVVLLFGANKLPELARSSGQAMGEFQKGRAEIERELKDAASTETPTTRPVERDESETVEPEKTASN